MIGKKLQESPIFEILVAFALLYLLTLVGSVPELDEAREHYQEMKYGLALKSLAKAITLPGISRGDRAQIYLLTALCRHQQGDIKGSQNAFREALTLDRGIALPAGTSPKAALLFENIRSTVAASAPVESRVDTVAPPPTSLEPAVSAAQPQPILVEATPPPPKAKLYWPAIALGSLAVASGGVGAIFGVQARQSFARAQNEEFGSDGQAWANRANTQALAANVLYAAAGALLVSAVVAFWVF